MEHPDITKINRDGYAVREDYEATCAFCGMSAVRGEYIEVRGRAFCSSPDCARRAYSIYASGDLTDFADDSDLTDEACSWWFKNNLKR